MSSLPRWFRPAPGERLLLQRAGVRRFRPFVAGGSFWRRRGWLRGRREWRPSNVAGYVRRSVTLEVVHTGSLLVLGAVQAIAAWDSAWLALVGFTVLNLAANVVPIMVIRFNRHRLVERLARRSAGRTMPS